MAVHPIEERYGTTEMRAVWSEKYRFACVVAAEVALAKSEAAYVMIPAKQQPGSKSTRRKHPWNGQRQSNSRSITI